MKKLLLLLIILSLSVALVVGCGDDDNGTNPTNKEEGTLQDEDFLMAQEAMYSADNFSDELFGWMEILIDTVFEDSASLSAGKVIGTASTADEITVTYHETSGYWYLYFSSADTIFAQDLTVEEIVTVVLEDSVQFMHGDAAVQWPDSLLLTGVNNGAILTLDFYTGFGSASATQNVTVVGQPGELAGAGEVTLNGNRTFDLEIGEEGGGCTVTLDGDAAATSVAMDLTAMENDGCPLSGNLLHTATIAIECTGDTTFSFTDTWTFHQTFYGDSTIIVAENSTTRWQWTELCGTAITRPYAEIFAAIKER